LKPALPGGLVHPGGLPPGHLLLALGVVAIWGTNFVVIKFALAHLPPILLAALRFLLVALPMVFILPRPRVPTGQLAAYGVLIGVGQFGALYFAMNDLISPGIASLVIQTQIFFTILLAMALDGERVHGRQWLGLAVAALGIATILAHTDGTTTAAGIAIVLFAAAGWAGGNLVVKRAGRVNMVSYVAWSSLFAVPPLFALSLAVEGWSRIAAGLGEADTATWLAVLWQSAGNSLFGYAAWGWLLARHRASAVSPLAMLIPVFGLLASNAWLGEPLPPWKWIAIALVMAGIFLNLSAQRRPP
jgi:O-acetylserine/cysteine efflux transporter